MSTSSSSPMLVAYDLKTSRVKGLSFHPSRPWVLASLHSGVINLIDYRMGTVIDKFEEHDGPVRGVDFHKMQPLFVSGGDDNKIKVWDYNLRRCLFTLLGHLDYIRTVQFHHEHPWIVSASDDQTIRIWNWQSRTCVSVLTGHNHYVMSASFHPKEPLVVSASLDQSVRVWDTSGLRKKVSRGMPADDPNSLARVNADFFGGSDAIVKHVLEGHERGVNWASFHPTMPLIVSGADDRVVKIWRINESKAWEVDSLRGHTNNVSCVLFHPRRELVISNSEDFTMRVWDTTKRCSPQVFRREHERFWILATHPTQNLLAAGHDGGLMVFKLERERPACASANGELFYVKDWFLRRCVLGTGADVPLNSIRRPANAGLFGAAPTRLELNPYNPRDNNLLLFSAASGTYELYSLNTQGENEPLRGSGVAAAVFLARERFATLDAKNQVVTVRSMNNQLVRRFSLSSGDHITTLFCANSSGKLLLGFPDRVTMLNVTSRRTLGDVVAPRVKYVVWNKDSSMAALISRTGLVIVDKDLHVIVNVPDRVLKSGVWDPVRNVFVYTTLTHVKYLLPMKGATPGIIRTLPQPLYAVELQGDSLFCLDREHRPRAVELDTSEYSFKLALAQGQYEVVQRTIHSGRLCGQAVISYLQQAGYPEVALFFVTDPESRFQLALQCGKLEIAQECANVINKDDAWTALGNAAVAQGNYEIAEAAFSKTGNLGRQALLAVLSGNTTALRNLAKLAGVNDDIMAAFHVSLFLGDVEARVKLLEDAKQLSLAYLTAATHGLTETADRLREALAAKGLPIPEPAESASYITPPTPLLRAGNWAKLNVARSVFHGLTAAGPRGAGERAEAPVAVASEAVGDPFGDMDLSLDEPSGPKPTASAGAAAGASAWPDADLGLDLDLDAVPEPGGAAAGGGGGGASAAASFRCPPHGTSVEGFWIQNSSVPGDCVAAGAFDNAQRLLNRQIGVVNVAPLREAFRRVFLGARAFVPTLPGGPSLSMPLTRNPLDRSTPDSASQPVIVISLSLLSGIMEQVRDAFKLGQFALVKQLTAQLFAMIPLTVVKSNSETAQVKALLHACTDYAIVAELEGIRKASAENIGRQLEAAAFMTHCNLSPEHTMKVLELAMVVAFKAENFIHAASFARRLQEMPATAEFDTLLKKARAVLVRAEAQGRNAIEIDYDPRNPFVIDCAAFKPIYAGSKSITCSYCAATYAPSYSNKTCKICNLSVVGVETLGLVVAAHGAGARGGGGGGRS